MVTFTEKSLMENFIFCAVYQGRKSQKVQKQCLKLIQKTHVLILESTKLIGQLPSTIQAVLRAQTNFRNLQQQEIQELKTKGSYCKKVILNRNSKKELQWWIQNLNICNGRYLVQSHSQVLVQPERDGVQYVKGYQQGDNGQTRNISYT